MKAHRFRGKTLTLLNNYLGNFLFCPLGIIFRTYPLSLKTRKLHIRAILLFISIFFLKSSFGQGHVVINEYMPWTLNGCGATAEFVELMNFGPGPMNIGCYILTDGDYSVTIPPNTILQPGEFYVIAGQDSIPFPCANIDSSIHADLNWNSCGCTSAPIPTTGDGFFTDGGFASEQVVLLDPNLKVVDAVVRDLPAEPSSAITTSNIGGCGSKTFNLDTMSINYEILGMSTGRGNSFARKLDGDCGWVKDPQQSGNATNNTPGESSDISYTLTIVQSMDCNATHGSIDIAVDVGGYSDPVFPMNYIIAYDADSNEVFDFSDTYTYGADSTPPSVNITGLPLGTYKITVGSVNGCFLHTFDVTILQCHPLLPAQLIYFKLLHEQSKMLTFEWLIGDVSAMKSIHLEKSIDGISYITASALDALNFSGSRLFTQTITKDNQSNFYRLRLTDKTGKVSYSTVIKTASNNLVYKTGPNPVNDKLLMQLNSSNERNLLYSIYNLSGQKVNEGQFKLKTGINNVEIPVHNLSPGIYQLFSAGSQSLSIRFVKN
jgi:hypothetical protein